MKQFVFGAALFAAIGLGATAQNCKIWYVAADGASTQGTVAAPSSLKYAVLNATSDRNTIRCLAGSYTVDTILPIQDNMIIDGAYVLESGSWVKKTNAVSEITFSGTEEVDANIAHVAGLKANGVNNWKLVDLSIITSDASGATASGVGKSVYGIWVKDAQGAKISRVKVLAGDASNGTDGVALTGTGGGANGGNGGSFGNHGNDCNNGSAGSPGSVGTSGGAPGGTAGTAGTSGGCNFANCNKTPANGGNGGNGNPGANGNGFAPGDRAVTPAVSSDFYTPQITPEQGEAGKSGGGGGGGGGAARGTACTCSTGCDDNICGNGGAGGTGGAGGIGGNGGQGGGGSFAVYVTGISDLTINDSELTAGNAGTGGNGSNGLSGNVGVNGAAGTSGSRCDVNYNGGNGGNGGKGGDGGRGRDGANGLSEAIAFASPAVVTPVGTTIANGTEISVKYANSACANSEVNISKASGTWTLPTDAAYLKDTSPTTSSYNNNSNNAIVFFTQPGSYTLSDGATVATDFIQVTETRNIPTINNIPASLCQGYTLNLGTSSTGTEYDWIIYSTTVTNVIYSSSLQNPGTSAPLPALGNYVVRLRVKDACCGWSIPVYQAINVVDPVACLSVEEFVDMNFNIFPNPMMDELVIKLNNNLSEQPSIRIMDASGRIIESRRLPMESGSTNISVSSLTSGVYILELTTSQGVFTKKLIKQ